MGADEWHENLAGSRAALEEKITKVSEEQSQYRVQAQADLVSTRSALEERVSKFGEEHSQARLRVQNELTEFRSSFTEEVQDRVADIRASFERQARSLTEGQSQIQTAVDAAQKSLKEDKDEAQVKLDTLQKQLAKELKHGLESVTQQQQEYFSKAEDALESRLSFITVKQDQLQKSFDKLSTEAQEHRSALDGLNLEVRLEGLAKQLQEGIV